MSVSYDGFAQLIPEKFDMLRIEEIVRRLCLDDVEILGPFLEEEGLRAFEYWGGEYRPLEELLEHARFEREKQHLMKICQQNPHKRGALPNRVRSRQHLSALVV